MNKNKALTYCSFMVTSLVVVLVFVSATTYIMLAVGILLYLPLAYFALRIFPRKKLVSRSKKSVVVKIQPLVKIVEKEKPEAESSNKQNWGIADIDKRTFLKLIGGAGLSLFLFSIFNKKAESLFFKNIPASGASGTVTLADINGKKIDPAQSQPMDGYRISEVDDNIIMFYGFTNKDGAWFIMKEDTDTGSFRYARAASNFPGNWANRENLKYDYFNNIF